TNDHKSPARRAYQTLGDLSALGVRRVDEQPDDVPHQLSKRRRVHRLAAKRATTLVYESSSLKVQTLTCGALVPWGYPGGRRATAATRRRARSRTGPTPPPAPVSSAARNPAQNTPPPHTASGLLLALGAAVGPTFRDELKRTCHI